MIHPRHANTPMLKYFLSLAIKINEAKEVPNVRPVPILSHFSLQWEVEMGYIMKYMEQLQLPKN
jgi:hypothetical protein